jgi:hypothetical protein
MHQKVGGSLGLCALTAQEQGPLTFEVQKGKPGASGAPGEPVGCWINKYGEVNSWSSTLHESGLGSA